MSEVKFNSDTKYRKQFFTGLSFSHPAKMHLSLQLWLIDNFTKEGEIILDPMAGSGTILLACTMGRHVITVELENKFVQMQKGNWAKIQQRGPQLGYQMGTATILQGDARNLTGLLADKIITSPPFKEQMQDSEWMLKNQPRLNRGRHNPREQETGNIGNLPYGSIDSVISSPPYEETITQGGNTDVYKQKYGYQGENIGYTDRVDAVISSPPYEDKLGDLPAKPEFYNHPTQRKVSRYRDTISVQRSYGHSQGNIGNLKSDSYLQAMLQVYQQSYQVLKPSGLMILVTKNFIRNKTEIRLDLDTIKLCEQAGFQFVERHYRRLMAQSFWRTIYASKYPDAPVLNKEDILVFMRG